MKRFPGQVTVFLAMTALSLFALFSTCLEGARCACLDYLCLQAAESSLESVFAAFQGELLRDYGLLARQGREGEAEYWQDDCLAYAEKYLNPGRNTFYLSGDRIGLRDMEIAESDAVYLTEGNGAVFTAAVMTYMKTAGLSHLIQEILGRLGLYDEEEGLGLMDSLQQMLGDKEAGLEGIVDSWKDIKDQAKELQEEAKKKAQEKDIEYQEPIGTSEDVKTDLLEQIKAIRKNGLIAIITGDEELSAYAWDGEGLPSGLSEAEKSLHTGFEQESRSLLEHLLLGEYALYQMGNYRHHQEEGSFYEMEYVISGGKNDKKAFEKVIGEILLIRFGFNLAYLTTDAEKMALAEATAAGIMCLLALPQLIVALKWILLAAWALAESIVDVRGLVRGKKIPLWKTQGSWRLGAMKLDLSAQGGGTSGLGYEDYLRLLFCLGNRRNQSYRMMDVIQERLRLKLPAFRMREQMVHAEVKMEISLSYLYLEAPLIKEALHTDSGRRFTKITQYAYGRR